MNQPRHLVIFARYPTAGCGKRRLAAGIGTVQALRFQRVRISVLLARLARDPRWTTWLAVTPDRSGPWPAHVNTIGQGRGDLGQRLARVMRALPSGPVIIIGSDIPGIDATSIADAFAVLAGRDAVFGPAGDGGYWLIGLARVLRLIPNRIRTAVCGLGSVRGVGGAAARRTKRMPARRPSNQESLRLRAGMRTPFAGVRWSSRHALADTLANLPGARIGLVQSFDDVDTAADLARHPGWARVVRSPAAVDPRLPRLRV